MITTHSSTPANSKSRTPGGDSNYAADTPVTRSQRTMRLAHMASYVHEDAGHNLDHVKSALTNLKSGNSQGAMYDLNHALPHAQGAHAKSSKMVEQTHSRGNFATSRQALLSNMQARSK